MKSIAILKLAGDMVIIDPLQKSRTLSYSGANTSRDSSSLLAQEVTVPIEIVLVL